jgi:ribosomal protein S18 acetylase RimI-like enzyme
MIDITIRPIDYSRDRSGLTAFLVERDQMRLEHCELAVRDGDAFIFVADDGNSPVGWVAVPTSFREDQDWSPPDDDTRSFQSGDNAYVENIEVTARARSGGVGRKLLSAAQEEARRRGKSTLWLHTSENNALAHRLFEREGWKHERSVYPLWKPTSKTRIYKKVL